MNSRSLRIELRPGVEKVIRYTASDNASSLAWNFVKKYEVDNEGYQTIVNALAEAISRLETKVTTALAVGQSPSESEASVSETSGISNRNQNLHQKPVVDVDQLPTRSLWSDPPPPTFSFHNNIQYDGLSELAEELERNSKTSRSELDSLPKKNQDHSRGSFTSSTISKGLPPRDQQLQDLRPSSLYEACRDSIRKSTTTVSGQSGVPGLASHRNSVKEQQETKPKKQQQQVEQPAVPMRPDEGISLLFKPRTQFFMPPSKQTPAKVNKTFNPLTNVQWQESFGSWIVPESTRDRGRQRRQDFEIPKPTFHPKINPQSHHLQRSQSPIGERLYLQARSKQAKRAKELEELASSDPMRFLSIDPPLSPIPRHSNQTPNPSAFLGKRQVSPRISISPHREKLLQEKSSLKEAQEHFNSRINHLYHWCAHTRQHYPQKDGDYWRSIQNLASQTKGFSYTQFTQLLRQLPTEQRIKLKLPEDPSLTSTQPSSSSFQSKTDQVRCWDKSQLSPKLQQTQQFSPWKGKFVIGASPV